MMRPSISPLLLGLIALPGCSSSEDGNPRVLWLAPFDRTELRVRLADTEPPPY